MKRLRTFLDFYINSSIHVALANTALVCISFLKFSITNTSYLLFTFFSSIVGYNFVKYFQRSHRRHRYLIESSGQINVVTILSLLAAVLLFFQLSRTVIWVLLPFGLMTVLYSIPVLPGYKNLRSVARGKIFIIAIVWTGVNVIVPVYDATQNVDFNFFIESLQRFLFVVVLMFPFEIRDLAYDSKSLQTIPQLVGVAGTKVLGTVLLFLFFAIGLLKYNLNLIEMASNMLIVSLTLFLLWNAKKEQGSYYCSFWVESIPIAWLFLYYGLVFLFR